jgi:hypothetical protein
MAKYITVVIKLPETKESQSITKTQLDSVFQVGNKISEGEVVAMSLEDEMTVLELIEQHEDFDPCIAEQARAKSKELHAAAELVTVN